MFFILQWSIFSPVNTGRTTYLKRILITFVLLIVVSEAFLSHLSGFFAGYYLVQPCMNNIKIMGT
jgi:hypothetical protein